MYAMETATQPLPQLGKVVRPHMLRMNYTSHDMGGNGFLYAAISQQDGHHIRPSCRIFARRKTDVQLYL